MPKYRWGGGFDMSKKALPLQLDLIEHAAEVGRETDTLSGGPTASGKLRRKLQAKSNEPQPPAASPAKAPRQTSVDPVRDKTDVAYLSDKQVAKHYGVSRATIWRWTKEVEDFPGPVLVGAGTTRWRLADIEEYDRQRPPIGSGRCGKVEPPVRSEAPLLRARRRRP